MRIESCNNLNDNETKDVGTMIMEHRDGLRCVRPSRMMIIDQARRRLLLSVQEATPKGAEVGKGTCIADVKRICNIPLESIGSYDIIRIEV